MREVKQFSLSLFAVPDILGDLESALALKEEMVAAGHTLSDDFISRLETMTQSHSQTGECTWSHSHTSFTHSSIPGAKEYNS